MMKNKKVIYTCIVGGYDTLMQPAVIDDSFDYICFVKKGQRHSEKQGVWRIEEIPYDCPSGKQLSAYTKLQPHVVLSQYDYSLWIDGNISINDAGIYEVIDKKIEEGVSYSGVNHLIRDCAYDDAAAVAYCHTKVPMLSLIRTVLFLKKEHFPMHYGLYETGVTFRKHNDPTIVKFDNLWWQLFCKYAKRDQLCHTYCLKKFGIEFNYLLPKEYCARNHPYFNYVMHNNMAKRPQGFANIKRKINRRILKYLSLI
jgi:hypothetical protein